MAEPHPALLTADEALNILRDAARCNGAPVRNRIAEAQLSKALAWMRDVVTKLQVQLPDMGSRSEHAHGISAGYVRMLAEIDRYEVTSSDSVEQVATDIIEHGKLVERGDCGTVVEVPLPYIARLQRALGERRG